MTGVKVTLTGENKLLVKPTVGLGRELHTLGGRYDKKRVGWIFPLAHAYLYYLWDLYGKGQVDIDTSARNWYRMPRGVTRSFGDRLTRLPLPILDKLLPFQAEALAFLESSPHHGSILALHPGLGKTMVSIAYAHIMQYRKVLVVAPKSVVPGWIDQLQTWAHEIGQISHGDRPQDGYRWTITNYDNLNREYRFSKHGAVLEERGWHTNYDLLILDESIYIAHRDTYRSKVLHEMGRRAQHVLLLSGSPIRTYYTNLWSQLKAIDPTLFPSYWRFAKYYCHTEDGPYGTQILGNKGLIPIKDHLSDLMYVRSLDDVITLPPYLHETLYCDLLPDQEEMYRKAKDEFLLLLDEDEEVPIASRMAQITRLQQIVSHTGNLVEEGESGKIKSLFEHVDTHGWETPALIWTHWKGTAGPIADECLRRGLKVAIVNGDTKKPDLVLADYKAGHIDVLILSLGVGKYGHTLINTRTVIYMDLTFDADAYVQSLPRVRRLGLDHAVLVYRLICKGTTDDLVTLNLEGKLPGIAHVTNAKLRDLLRGVR